MTNLRIILPIQPRDMSKLPKVVQLLHRVRGTVDFPGMGQVILTHRIVLREAMRQEGAC